MEICSESLSLSPSWVNDARIAVNVVPILAPNVRGKTRSRVMTPRPTSGVKVDVNMLDDWTSMVSSAPTIMAM